MKKNLLLILCCIAFVVSGMAQPEHKNIPEKFFKKTNLEKLHLKNHLEKEKTFFAQKHFFSFQNQHQTKSQRNTDWWEPDTIHGYYLDGGGERHLFSYKNGNCTVQLVQGKLNSQWENAYQVLYNYDSQNNRIEELAQVWESGMWQNDSKITSTFDSQNNETSLICQYWESGQWINTWKAINVYDSQNNMIEETYQFWESGTWINDGKWIYSYNAYNNLTETLFHIYEVDQWIPYGVQTFTYNAQNNWSEILVQYFEDGQWTNYNLESFTYNEQNQCIFYIFQGWIFGQWENEDKYSLTYDAQGNLTSELWQYGEEGEWRNGTKLTWSYNENRNATSGTLQYWADNAWVDGVGGLFIPYNNAQSVADAEGYRFTATYIDPKNVGIKENELLKQVVKTYPNPVSNILYIENHSNTTPEVKIYSIQGALLINAKGTQIDVSSLPKGVYVAEINGISRKIVKQ